ncbi:hypothetical protein BB934_28885 (plasmid) [Microvirga ossetica]|uniref:Uncharacterized protein n=1 Tax=Microvirga ossetica TaxID=1882682 RepID=A0A1B2ER91_9HYPH|nr:hypothetical protein BB934_28885 [Microvirga ossetica]
MLIFARVSVHDAGIGRMMLGHLETRLDHRVLGKDMCQVEGARSLMILMFATAPRAAEGQGPVDLVLDPDERI